MVIGSGAFGNSGLIDVNIPDGVVEIEENAFGGCSKLKRIVLPKSVAKMWPDIFEGCINLIDIIVEPNSYAEQYCIENHLIYKYTDASAKQEQNKGVTD